MRLRAGTLYWMTAALLSTAAPVLAQNLAPDGHDAESLLAAGRQAVERGSVIKGVELFKQSLANHPSREALVELGCALSDLEKWEEARSAFQNALKLKSDDAPALNGLGYVCYRQAKMGEAIEFYRLAITQRDDPQFRLNLGLAYLAQERWGQASDEFEVALNGMPDNYWAHNNLGYALQKCGHRDLAEDHYRAAISSPGDAITAHLNLGGLLLDAHEWREACDVYLDALRKRDDSADAHLGLALAYARMDKLLNAEIEARVAVTLDPKKAQSHHLLAEIYRKLRQWGPAQRAANAAVACSPGHAAYHLTLGMTREGGGNIAGAIASYQQYLLLEPEGADAREVRARLRSLQPSTP